MPVPYGEQHALNVDGSIFTLVLTGTIRGEEANNQLLQFNSSIEPPPEGMEYIMALVTVSYGGADTGPLDANKYDWSVLTGNRVIDPFHIPFVLFLRPDFDFNLLPGGSGTGWVMMIADINDPDPLFVWAFNSSTGSGVYMATH